MIEKIKSHYSPKKSFQRDLVVFPAFFVEIFEGSLRWPMLRASNHTNFCYFWRDSRRLRWGIWPFPVKCDDWPMGRYKGPGDFLGHRPQQKWSRMQHIARSLMFFIQIHRTQVFWHISFQESPIRYEVSRIFYCKKAMSLKVKDYKDDDIPLGLLAI